MLAASASSVASADECRPVALRDVTAVAGVEFIHDHGGTGAKHLPESMGAGLAWLDADGDGWLDLWAVQSGPFPADEPVRDTLFRNLGTGRFVAKTGAVPAVAGYGQGVAAADVDGDGDVDVLRTAFGPAALLRNLGDGAFVDDTAAAGLAIEGWSSSSAFADGDADGDLDLYVARYVDYSLDHGFFCGDPESGRRQYCDPSFFLGAADLYLRGSGDGTFSDATSEVGLGAADGRGLGVVWSDLDGDAAPDLYVANDLTVNLLFANVDGTYQDLSLLSGAAVNLDGKPEAGMGIAVGDVDGDGDPDLAVTNFDVETNTLYRNLGGLAFADVAAASGFGLPSFNRLAFGIVAVDLDRDGDLDFYVGNGHIFERPERENVAYEQPDQVLLGDGRGGFAEQRCADLDKRRRVSRGVAWADMDNDGDPDISVQANGGPLALLRNEATSGSWLGLRLVGAGANTAGVGARVTLTSEHSRQVRWVVAGDSYQSTSDPRVLFGLAAGDLVLEVEVAWPSGARQRLIAPPSGRYLTLREPTGDPAL